MLVSAAGARSGAGPLDQQQGGVVAQAAAALMLEHGPHQASQQFFGRPAAGGFPLQQVDQPVQPERSPSAVRASVTPSVYKSTRHRVRVRQRAAGCAVAEPERQHRITAELGDILRPRSSSGRGCPAHDHSSRPDPVASRAMMPVANETSS
jgi:hypothetical protein